MESGTTTTAASSSDGRRARRERNRTAVIDAMFSLMQDGHFPPPTELIADRAGVSVSSVFRYFDDLDDLQRETIDRYFERFAHLFVVPDIGEGPLEPRVSRFVDARLDLYETIDPIARMARFRAVEHDRIARSLAETRAAFADQVRRHFSPELDATTPAAADDIVALVDSLTAYEAWELLQHSHGRSRHQIRRAWTRGITAILA